MKDPFLKFVSIIFFWKKIKESFLPRMSDFCIVYMNERGWKNVPLLTPPVCQRLTQEAYRRAKNIKGDVYIGQLFKKLEEVSEAVYQYHCSETDDVQVKEILSFHDKPRNT